MEVNQAIFLRVANKSEQIELSNALERERETFSSLDPIHASQIFINKTLKAGKQYVVAERKYRAPFTAFFQDEKGLLSKITIDPERHRIIRLMLKDKKSREEVEDVLNGLTEDEVSEFYPDDVA